MDVDTGEYFLGDFVIDAIYEEAERAEQRRKQMKKIVENLAKAANFSLPDLDGEERISKVLRMC